MKRLTAEWVKKAEADWIAAASLFQATPTPRNAFHDQVGFHCQQAAEKYLKALMQESGMVVPRIHDLEDLLNLLLPSDPGLAPLRLPSHILTPYAVGYRYPGAKATKRQARAALTHAAKVRAAVRPRLGLPV